MFAVHLCNENKKARRFMYVCMSQLNFQFSLVYMIWKENQQPNQEKIFLNMRVKGWRVCLQFRISRIFWSYRNGLWIKCDWTGINYRLIRVLKVRYWPIQTNPRLNDLFKKLFLRLGMSKYLESSKHDFWI